MTIKQRNWHLSIIPDRGIHFGTQAEHCWNVLRTDNLAAEDSLHALLHLAHVAHLGRISLWVLVWIGLNLGLHHIECVNTDALAVSLSL